MKLLLTCLLSIATFVGYSQVQCAIDVTINEGDTIEMCKNALVPITASNGFASYGWSGPETGVSQSFSPSVSGQFVVAAVDGIGCISTDTIIVIVHNAPVDAIVSSAGDTLCTGPGSSTLSLSNSYVLYDWGGGVTTPTHDVTTSGNYSVDVADNNNCVTTFSFNFVVLEFAVDTTYGNDCTGGAVLMEASGGSTYSWSTGETGHTIVITPLVDTNVIVTITEGSCVQDISTTVTPSENYIDFALPDTLVIPANEMLIIVGPLDYDAYLWFPNDQLLDSTGQLTHFEGTESQTITLQGTHPDGCVLYFSTVVIVIDLDVPNGFSPNGDLINDAFVIPELDVTDGSLVVWNRWGDIVFKADNYENNWKGTCEGRFCLGKEEPLPEGTYFYQVDVLGITKEGYVTLRR